MADGVVVLRWVGDVDVANVESTRAEIDQALDRPGTSKLVIDLAQLDFVDSLGVGTLIYARNNGAERGVPVALRGVPDSTDRLLEAAGLGALFPRERA